MWLLVYLTEILVWKCPGLRVQYGSQYGLAIRQKWNNKIMSFKMFLSTEMDDVY